MASTCSHLNGFHESPTTKLILGANSFPNIKITISNGLLGRVLFHEIKQYNITALKRSGMINNAPGISLYREFIMLAFPGKYPHHLPLLWTAGSRSLLPLTNGSPCPVSRLPAQKAVSSTQGLPCVPCLEEHHQISVVLEFQSWVHPWQTSR